MDYKKLISQIGFIPKENTSDIYIKKYSNNYSIEIDFAKQQINYGNKIKTESKTTQNFSQPENFVVLECVDRLLTKGYSPKNIILEKTFPLGHNSGRLDILITREDGTAYLMIECKTYGKEFDNAFKKLKKDGGQLFTYFQQDKNTNVLMLYSSELKGNKVEFKNEIVHIEDDYRQTSNVKDFFDRWNKLPVSNGIFDEWVKPYNFQSKALTTKELKEIKQEDSSFIFNRFLEILRHNVVSDKGNAFNKIFTLFLCKIYDEKVTTPNEELKFQWLEGKDDDITFQMRLTDLYGKGMYEFLEKKVTDFDTSDFENKYGTLDKEIRNALLKDIIKLRLEKNNEFAIKEVYDEKSFQENAKVVKQVVELLQGFKIRYTKKQQYLSDFFELLLTTGLKQESGQFFTPVPVSQFIIKSLPIDNIIKEKLQKGEKNNLLPYVIDYAAGSGHFITEAMHQVQQLINKKEEKDYISDTAKKIKTWKDDHFDWAFQYVYGVEKDYRLVKVGKVGCYLHGDGLANVIHSDGLGNFTRTPEYKGKLSIADKEFTKENKEFDIVVSNPPYSVSAFRPNARNYYTENDFELYDYLTDNSSEIECLFVERTKQLLKDGGVAGIILPSSILSNTGIYTKTREIIFKYFEIVAITELGSNTFMATGTNTVVLFLRRRNNYDYQNFAARAENSLNTYQDNVINGIEKPIAKYLAHVWENISFDDYITLLKKQPNEAIQSHEIYKDYNKKIKTKNEAEKWQKMLETEKEKLLFFILAYPQKVVLVKSGDKDTEKRFLGYEFSNRRGSEGIHPIQRGKTIEECTQLFDDNNFENPEKASTYIYQAFKKDYTKPINPKLEKHIFRMDLVDMMTFDRVDFEKTVSLAVKKKVKIEDIWETDKLKALEEIAIIQKGISITKEKVITGDIPVVAGGQEPAYFHNQANREGNIITVSASGAYSGFINYFEKPIFASDCNTICSKNETIISTKLIYWFLKSIQKEVYHLQRGQAQPHVYADDLKKIKIPLPPKDIQEKIVAEIEVLEKKERKAKEKIADLKEKISNRFITPTSNYETKKLGEVCEMKAGDFVKVGDINNSFEDGLYPCYGGNGLRGYIKTYTHEGTYSLIGRQGALCGNVHLVSGKFHATEHALVVTPKLEINTIWLYHKLIAMNLNQYATGTAQPGLSVMNLTSIDISLPPLSEQQKIVSEIEKIDAEIAQLEKEIAEIPKQKEEVLKKYL